MADVLITGFPSFIARRLTAELVTAGDNVRILTRHRHRESCERFVQGLQGPGSTQVLMGDVVLMDLGLSGPEVRRLLQEVEVIFHMAAVPVRSQRADRVQAVNVDGTRSILELAMGADRLRRFNFLSTAYVSGDRQGVVMEEDLIRPGRFRTEFERTKFEAEEVIRRASADIPISVFRPSLIVGDSQTGEFDPEDDPYHAMLGYLRIPLDMPVPLPGRGDYPLNLVPVDYVVRAMRHISSDPRAVGLTFHLTDPNPLPARRVLDLISDSADRPRPRGQIPAPLARRLLKLPGMARLAPAVVVEYFNQLVIYNTENTMELLAGTDVRCPPFRSYVENLVAHLRQTDAPRREGAA